VGIAKRAGSFNFDQGRLWGTRPGRVSYPRFVPKERPNLGHTAVVLQLTPKEGVEAHGGGFQYANSRMLITR